MSLSMRNGIPDKSWMLVAKDYLGVTRLATRRFLQQMSAIFKYQLLFSLLTKMLNAPVQVASKVGPDFLYRSQITHPPNTIEGQQTTQFFADFTQGEERVLTAGNICEPIEPEDIPDVQFELGLAVGIACEVLPETLEQMVNVSRYVVVDVQVSFLKCSM